MQTAELGEHTITRVWCGSKTVTEVKRKLRKKGYRIPLLDLLIWADYMRTDEGVPLPHLRLV